MYTPLSITPVGGFTRRHLNESLNQDNVLKEFLRKGGLRCQILTSSSINIGDKIEVLD